LTKRLIDYIGIPCSRVRSKIRAMPESPYFDI
jgi:hypothetical protein